MGQGRRGQFVWAWGALVIALVAPVVHAQEPADTARRPRPAADTARAPQPIEGLRIEAKPDPKPSTPADLRLRFGGHLLTKTDFERVGATGWMDAARLTPGVHVIVVPVRPGAAIFARRLEMRAAGGRCTPAIFLNGVRQTIFEYDWDQFLPIEAVERMEVYSSTNAPIEFRTMTGSCGSVVMWTRPESR